MARFIAHRPIALNSDLFVFLQTNNDCRRVGLKIETFQRRKTIC